MIWDKCWVRIDSQVKVSLLCSVGSEADFSEDWHNVISPAFRPSKASSTLYHGSAIPPSPVVDTVDLGCMLTLG